MVNETRLTVAERRQQILAAAFRLSRKGGLYDWSLDNVAQEVGITRPLINYHFGSDNGLRTDVILTAVRCKDYEIIVQAMVRRDPCVANLDSSIRRAAARYLSKVA